MRRPKPYTGSENYIFASYSHDDREKVFETIREMQQKGYRIWFDAAIRPGHEWDDELADKIDGCSCFIAFMSENYKKSENCKDELSYARDHEKTRVLILLEPVDLSRGGLAMRNNRVQQISKFSYTSSEDFFEDFSEANNVASCMMNDPQPVAALPPVADSVKSVNTSADGVIGITDFATKASTTKSTDDTYGAIHDVEKSGDKTVGGSVMSEKTKEIVPNNATTGASGTEHLIDPLAVAQGGCIDHLDAILCAQDEANGYAFVSYSSQREEETLKICSFLEENGINLWKAPQSILPGESYPAAIKRGIQSCHCFLLLMTQQSVVSPFVKKELEMAIKLSKPVIPLQIDPDTNDDMDWLLGLTHRITVDSLESDSDCMQALLKGVIGYAGQNIRPQTGNEEPPAEETPSADTADENGNEQIPPAVSEQATVEEVVKAYNGVIPKNAFKDRTDLVHVILPDTVTSIGSGAFEGCTQLCDLHLPEGLQIIPENAFCNCTSLQSVSIPQSVHTIADNAFCNCSSLQRIFIPDSVTKIGKYAFDSCTALTAVRLPNQIKELEDYVFNECSALTEITVPDSVTEIGRFAFCDCTALTAVKLSENLTSIGYSAFKQSGLKRIEIPDSVTQLGNWAFEKCKDLKNVSLPSHLKIFAGLAFSGVSSSVLHYRDANASQPAQTTSQDTDDTAGTADSDLRAGLLALLNGKKATDDSKEKTEDSEKETETDDTDKTASDVLRIPAGTTVIEKDAYKNRTDITAVIFPQGLLEIGSGAFAGCVNLQSVSVPDGVHTVGRNAFKDCSALQSVVLPESLRVIRRWAFKECTALQEIILPDALEKLEEMAFNGCISLSAIRIPHNIQTIPDSAFSSCTALSEVILHDNITEIGDYAFKDCSCVTSITWPKNLTKIGKYAFKGCAALTDIRLPEALTHIADYAFSVCTALTNLYLPESLTSVGNWAFKDCDALQSVTLSKQIRAERFRLFGNVSDSVFSTFEDHAQDDAPAQSESDSIAKKLRELLGAAAQPQTEDQTQQSEAATEPQESEAQATVETVADETDTTGEPTSTATTVETEPTGETAQPASNADQSLTPPPVRQFVYYYAVNGESFGPYSKENIVTFIRQGTIHANTYLWRSDMTAWVAANTVPEFASMFNPVPPPLPPIQ